MKRAAVFIERNSIGNSPSIINLLTALSQDYYVDIFARFVELTETKSIPCSNIKILKLGRKRSLNYWIIWLYKWFQKYDVILAVDPHGFVFAKTFFPKCNPIYYSLELYLREDHFGLDYSDQVMLKERTQIGDISGLIIQSEEKEAAFRKDYQLDSKIPSFLLPVTYQGPPVYEKSFFLHERYALPKDKKIALHLGGITEWFSCEEMILAFSELSDWILFFQGYPDRNYLKYLRELIAARKIDNVIFSNTLYSSLDELSPVISSCDIGIAWYKNISAGFRMVGKSSGKIASYLKFGLPIVASRFPSTVEVIEKGDCGVCIENLSDISGAVSSIERNYTRIKDNCWRQYEQTFRFDNYQNSLLEFITRVAK